MRDAGSNLNSRFLYRADIHDISSIYINEKHNILYYLTLVGRKNVQVNFVYVDLNIKQDDVCLNNCFCRNEKNCVSEFCQLVLTGSVY